MEFLMLQGSTLNKAPSTSQNHKMKDLKYKFKNSIYIIVYEVKRKKWSPF